MIALASLTDVCRVSCGCEFRARQSSYPCLVLAKTKLMKRLILLLALLAFGLPSSKAVDSVVVFNEIHYHPPLDEALNEWVELHNQMAIDIDLSEWSLEGAVDFTFPEGTIIPGGGYLVIAANPTALQTQTGIRNVVGPFSGRLNNGTGQLELRDRNDRLMDEIEYRDEGKWPIEPDGGGATLAKRDPNLTSDAPENWTSSVLVDGTPGLRNFPATGNSYQRFLVPLNALWRYEASGTDLGTAWREPAFNDTAWSGRNAATLLSYWPFDGNPTATRGANGVLMNGPTATSDRNGVANGALAFVGTSSQWVSIPGGGGLNAAAAASISMWVKWTGTQDADCCGTFGAVLGRQANGQFSDSILALNNANPAAAQIVWRQSGGPAPVLITGTSIVGTDWHHIVVTFGSGGSRLYVDGIAEGSAGGAGMNNNPGVPLSIGAWAFDGSGFSTASIDDVAIWNQPLSAAQVAELASQTKTPLDFATPESAIYFAGDGRVAGYDEFRQTGIPLGPTTHYFRHAFQFAGDPATAVLQLDTAVDDGAIFYLNGVEVHRHNMPAGPVGYSTLAVVEVGDAIITSGVSISASNLLPGTNVLAVEVHQAGPADAGMVFGAALNAVITPPPPVDTRPMITLHDSWKYDSSDTDLGTAWREAAYDDTGWTDGAGVLYAGTGFIDGIPPQRITSVSATASSQYLPDGRLAARAVDGSGLNGNAHVTAAGGNMWLNNGTFALPNDLNPFISFDLGDLYKIRSMKVWNYNEVNLTARGVALADILLAGTNGTFAPFITGQALARAPGTPTDFSELLDFGGVEARYIRLETLTNFPGGDNRFVGLSEVQFFRDVDLRRTQVPLGAVTYYFRKGFTYNGDPASAELVLNAVFDDGAIFYLNGVEIHRANIAPGAVSHGTVASTAVGNATFTGPLVVPSGALQRGPNVLAVEIHQTAALSDTDMVFGADLTARVSPPSPEAFDAGGLVFNEISGASESAFQIELVNRSSQTIDTEGYYIISRGGPLDLEYVLPSQQLAPGAFLVLDSNTLGFGAAAGHKLFLVLPGLRGVADALEVHERPRARYPDVRGEWLTPSQFTPGANNAFQLHSEVVINEIFYNGPPILDAPAVITSNVPIISYTNEWRYEQSATDLGTAWRQATYDDSLWPVGRGLFYVTAATLAQPKNTPLTLGPTTYYFRTTLVNTGAPAILSMAMRHIMDDGIVVYLNGTEIHRFNIAGTVSYSTTATTGLGNAIQRGPLSIPPASLITGTNVIAVEVHQAADPGGDVVFGLEIRGSLELVPAVPFGRSSEGWVELYNRSVNPVDLTGWRMDEGIDFRFPSNTFIPAGGYLVLAKNPAELEGRFPGIAVTGPYDNALSRSGERIVLRDAIDNPVDAVTYSDDGRWPEPPDGGGSSLELRDPRADNSAGEAWASSDEISRSAWRSYSYRGIAAASSVGPDAQWREFVIGLLDAGEVLLDDISVVETNATSTTQLIQNGSFTTGTNTWRIIGNHHGEVIDDPDDPGNKVLRLVATGSTEHMSNHGETTLANGRQVVNGLEYHISFRARWVSGSRLFHTRLYFNRLPRVTRLDIPNLRGTPGTQNTAFTANMGPTFESLRHAPTIPAPFAPVTISVKANDPDGVADMVLWSSVNGGSWSSTSMTLSGDGSYAAAIPGRIQGTIVQFYVEGTDMLGARSFFPSQGTNSRALYQVDDGLAATHGLHNMRLIALAKDSDDLFRTVNLMSNERIGCTVIYDEREVFYNVGLRLKGSEHSRTTTPRLGFNVAFASEQRFRGIHGTVAIDRSESTGFGQREMLIHQTLNHAGDVPTKYHDLIQVMAPRPEYTGTAELQLARYSDVFLDDQFDDGSDGTVFEYELVYQLNSTDTGTPEGNKVPNPDNVVGTSIRNLGDTKENYRWTFLIKNNEERDDFDRIMQFAKAMELTGAAFNTAISTNIDVDQWLRGVAVNALSGAGDSYGGDGAQHNVQFYVRPGDGRVLYFPHDVDAFFQFDRPIVPNGDVTKLIAVPANARAYYGHVLDILATTYNASYMTRWANHFGRLLPAQNFAGHLQFLIQRANHVTALVNAAVPNVPFAIGNNGGNNFSISNNTVTLTGTAPLGVFHIAVNGVAYPVNWTSTTAWSFAFPLLGGVNVLNVQALNRKALPVAGVVDTITITNQASGSPLPVLINEWMADNAAPGGHQDPADGLYQDWFELYNPNTNDVNLGGFTLTDNLSEPGKWPIPSGTIIPARGFLLVWADNDTFQNPTNLPGHLHAGFQLNNGGEAIGLYTPAGIAQHTVVFARQTENVSRGLYPDGDVDNIYSMTNWTPRAANTLSGPLEIIDVTFNSGIVTITWAAIPGRTYQVLYKDSLGDPAWLPLAGEVEAAGETAFKVDSVFSLPHRFYRVVRLDQ